MFAAKEGKSKQDKNEYMRTFHFLICVVFTLSGCDSEPPPRSVQVTFEQVQSQIAEYRNLPLVTANFSGPMRPYIVSDGKYQPLLGPELESELTSVDLLAPNPISGERVLFSGQDKGSGKFDLWLFEPSPSKLTNVSKTPGLDEGNVCVSPSFERVSYREGRSQKFVSGDRLKAPIDASLGKVTSVPGFQSCLFREEDQVLGVVRSDLMNLGARYTLVVCDWKLGFVSCESKKALKDVEHVTGFFETSDKVGVYGLLNGESFRRPLAFDEEFSSSVLSKEFEDVSADVLQLAGQEARVGALSRYYLLSDGPGKSAVVFSIRRIESRLFGVIATPTLPKLVAELRGGEWQVLFREKGRESDASPPITEVWIPGVKGGVEQQAFWFGDQNSKRVVVWLHGGPKENVSPRYSPYFDAINQLGFSVLALNYPGSTGRGSEFEELYSRAHLQNSLEALLGYLRSRGVRQSVVWSISSAIHVVNIWAEMEFPFSGVVIQAAATKPKVRERIRRVLASKGVPCFSIHGANDLYPVGEDDFVYQGGHDITRRAHFEEMVIQVDSFLQKTSRKGRRLL